MATIQLNGKALQENFGRKTWRYLYEDLEVDRRITSKWILGKQGG